VYIGQRGDHLGDIPAQDKNIDETHMVRAGKFRRYHGEGVIRQLLDIPTLLKNIRDAFYVVIGLWQSFWLLGKLKPSAVFIKGGFVGVPVGLAAALRHIPYITHDSDAMPGLANRIVAPWAKLHAVALPKEVYAYPAAKTETVGVPIAQNYHIYTKAEVAAARKQLDLPVDAKVVFVTGGGLGAQHVNEGVAACVPELLKRYPDLVVVQLAGRKHEATLRQQYAKALPPQDKNRVVIKGFINNLYMYSGAADVIITRAGATAIAEFAAQAKACIIIPSPFLAGGHQLKNAKVLADRKAAKMVQDGDLAHDPNVLMAPLVDLLDSKLLREQLGRNLATLAQSNAAKRLAMLLLEIATAVK
jgi:UDP-N-acetylglucosamine--N-acetylmuramyl-(pentapeptide) pyrophosphoryl-undecaprenol N-acetylglucosamine transferase